MLDPEIAKRIGYEEPPFELPVEKGKIKEFARAVLDDNPIYYDEAYAQSTPLGGIIAPPTFTMTEYHHWPRHPRTVVPLDMNLVLHGEQEFEYFAPIYAGDTLTGYSKVSEIYERSSRRGGGMLVVVVETTFYNQRGEKVQVARFTTLQTQQVVQA